MMNNVVLTGRLTKDPELRRANNGNCVCEFSLAVDRTFKREGEPDADFPRIVCFGKVAENLCQYQRKGALIGVTGNIQTSSYQDQNGKMIYSTKIVANKIDWLETKKAQDQNQYQNDYQNYSHQNNGYGSR